MINDINIFSILNVIDNIVFNREINLYFEDVIVSNKQEHVV
jgi:hypothetical protein